MTFSNVWSENKPASKCNTCGQLVYSSREMLGHVCDVKVKIKLYWDEETQTYNDELGNSITDKNGTPLIRESKE